MKGFNFYGTKNKPNGHYGKARNCQGDIVGKTRTFKRGFWIYRDKESKFEIGDTLHYCIATCYFNMTFQHWCNLVYKFVEDNYKKIKPPFEPFEHELEWHNYDNTMPP